jgi:hypothetical protein
VSGPSPKNYAFETMLIAIVIIVAMVFFLKSQWSH